MADSKIKVVVQSGSDGKNWLLFQNPESVLTASTPAEVDELLQKVQSAADRGMYVAGYLAYEAASGIDPSFKVHDLDYMPLAWFGVFKAAQEIDPFSDDEKLFGVDEWTPRISEELYKENIDRIKAYLEAGDSYQVNYTLRMQADFDGDPWSLFMSMCRAQQSHNCAYIETDGFGICSASPELFFLKEGRRLISRPMKGTSRRGMTLKQDDVLAESLEKSDKNRSENVMIVDMVRNDMGRVAQPGTVHVSSMYDIEKYPTVWQMTSTVECETDVSVAEIIKALFPCASITGAPKVHTMEIINELEPTPRGVYTGAMGYVAPNGDAQFNVAIRTVVVDRNNSTAGYGVGGGIVWDSDSDNEFDECRAKASVLASEVYDFELLETMLWEDGKGFYLLDDHLDRLFGSARYFDYSVDESKVRNALMKEMEGAAAGDFKVRLLLDKDGGLTLQVTELPTVIDGAMLKVGLASLPVSSENRFVYHKTTNRSCYEEAMIGMEAVDDVILYNERGEITESTIANIVIEVEGRKITPPVESGLLAGVFRRHLIEAGEVQEEVFTLDDVKRADSVWLINSVRKWIKVSLSID